MVYRGIVYYGNKRRPISSAHFAEVGAANKMAAGQESEDWQKVERPLYLREIENVKFINVSIKGYERKSSSGFPKEEYFAYRIVSM